MPIVVGSGRRVLDNTNQSALEIREETAKIRMRENEALADRPCAANGEEMTASITQHNPAGHLHMVQATPSAAWGNTPKVKGVVSGGWGKVRDKPIAASNSNTQRPMHSYPDLVTTVLPNDATLLLIRHLQVGIVDDVLKVAQLLASLVKQEHWFTENGAWIRMAKERIRHLRLPCLVSQHCESQKTGWLRALTLQTDTRAQVMTRQTEDLQDETEEVDERCERIISDLIDLLHRKHVQLTSAAFASVSLSCKQFCSSPASLQSSLMGKAPVITCGQSSFRCAYSGAHTPTLVLYTRAHSGAHTGDVHWCSHWCCTLVRYLHWCPGRCYNANVLSGRVCGVLPRPSTISNI